MWSCHTMLCYRLSFFFKFQYSQCGPVTQCRVTGCISFSKFNLQKCGPVTQCCVTGYICCSKSSFLLQGSIFTMRSCHTMQCHRVYSSVQVCLVSSNFQVTFSSLLFKSLLFQNVFLSQGVTFSMIGFSKISCLFVFLLWWPGYFLKAESVKYRERERRQRQQIEQDRVCGGPGTSSRPRA